MLVIIVLLVPNVLLVSFNNVNNVVEKLVSDILEFILSTSFFFSGMMNIKKGIVVNMLNG